MAVLLVVDLCQELSAAPITGNCYYHFIWRNARLLLGNMVPMPRSYGFFSSAARIAAAKLVERNKDEILKFLQQSPP